MTTRLIEDTDGTEPSTSSHSSPSDGETQPGSRDLSSSLEPSVGSLFGRYRVLGRIGEGGMGIVVAAHDPELDRRVAIKILRSDRPVVARSKPIEHTVRLDRDRHVRDLSREQLLAEARAVAQLSHPNLVTIFEVGDVGGQIFLVMELIDGETLAGWLKKERSVGEIVGAFVQAGRGLAAAHAAGLVHGDFKPENALVDRSGRVRVIDFGVARVAHADAGEGRVVGTPRYMAPEQIAGGPVDARADQFALCLALYEVLYRASPFPGASGGDGEPARRRLALEPLRPAVRRGPLRLERAILRGLARDPAARFSSTDELLAELERAIRRAQAIPTAALAFMLASSAAVAALVLTGEGETDPCDRVSQDLAGVWDPAAAARIRHAFAASSRPHAQRSVERSLAALEAYAGSWMNARRSACRAARSGEESSGLSDRRAACLDSRRLRLRALVRNLARADDKLVDSALELTANLDPVESCGDGEALLARPPPSADPAARAELAILEPQLADAEMVRRAGRAAEAERTASALLTRARALGDARLVAAVARLHGLALEDLGRPKEAREALLEAVRAAERAGEAPMAATILIDLVRVVGQRLAQRDEARGFLLAASAALERSATRDDPRLRASLIHAEGLLEREASNFARAVELQRRALALRRSILPADHPDIAVSENNLGEALLRLGRPTEGRAHHEEALAIRRRVFGDDHPLTGSSLVNIGVSYFDQGRLEEARSAFESALRLFHRMPETRQYPSVLSNLGSIARTTGRFEDARRYHEEALAIRRDRLGPAHPDVATSLHNLGGLYANLGDYERALETLRSALDIRRRALGEEDPVYAGSMVAVAETLLRLGQPRQALQQAQSGLALLVRRLGADHLRTGPARMVIGAAMVDLGRPRDAVPILERAVNVLPAAEPDHALAQFHLARALAAIGKRARARVLADEAGRQLSQSGFKRDVAALDAWSARALRR